ncbi:Response regulator [Verrucomicrobia bacterium]|nr:Response regulator [Verrucomicrobiota bacterium]
MADHQVILLVEDSEDEILLIRRAFNKACILNPLHVAKDGEEALSYLAGVGKFALRDEYPLPVLILLDLMLPGMNGFEVLRSIRRDLGLNNLCVLVLTSSENMRDVNVAYQLGANSFLVKEVDFQNTVELVRLIKDYWIAKSRMPEVSRLGARERFGLGTNQS